jgi:dienelactone hydrolase
MSRVRHPRETPKRFAARVRACFALLAFAALGGAHAAAQDVVCPAPAPGRILLDGFESNAQAEDLATDGPFVASPRNGTVTRGMRSTPWIAHVPAGGASAWPLVLLLPGAGVPLDGYGSLAQHLATHGFIVVRAAPSLDVFSPDHVAMASDLRAVIDAMLAPEALGAEVDASRIAVGGHGVGGKIAIMAADADVRIRALLLLDPLNVHGAGSNIAPDIVPQPTAAITRPIAVLGELTDSAGFQACAPLAINYQAIFDAAVATRRGYEWTIPGAAHMDFVSDPDACGFACSLCLAATAPVAQTRAFVRATSLAFLRTHLDVDAPACEWLTGNRLQGGVVPRQRVLP